MVDNPNSWFRKVRKALEYLSYRGVHKRLACYERFDSPVTFMFLFFFVSHSRLYCYPKLHDSERGEDWAGKVLVLVFKFLLCS